MRCATRFAALVVVLPLALLVAVVAQAQSPLPSAWCGDHPASCAPMQAASGMIDEIVSQSTRQDLLIDFAGGLAVLGLADEARAVLAGVAPEMGRYTRQFDAAHWIAITLAEAYSKAGQAEAAVAVLEAALAAAEANPNGDPESVDQTDAEPGTTSTEPAVRPFDYQLSRAIDLIRGVSLFAERMSSP